MKLKSVVLSALLVAACLVAHAAVPASVAPIQNGKLATVHLLKIGRAPSKAAPDGMAFLFLVQPAAGATGGFTLKETRDFNLAGVSYQEKTQAELGKRFEPGTTIDDAEKFFAKNPRLRGSAPEDIKGATILSIVIAGTKLPPDGNAEVTIHVGYDKQVEPFTFTVPLPAAAPANRSKS